MATALAAAMMAPAPASAQSGLIGTQLQPCVRPATVGDTATAMLAAIKDFDCAGNFARFGPGDFWVATDRLPASATAGAALNLRMPSLWQRRTTVFARYGDEIVRVGVFDGHGASHRLQLGAIVQQPLPVRAEPLTALLWHIEGAANLRGALTKAWLATPAESTQSNLLMTAVYAGFAGLCLALLVYNLAMWGALRHHFQLIYCVMVMALLGYAASSSGALVWAWPAIDNVDRLRFNYVTLGIAATSALAFARAFFEPRVFAGLLGRVTDLAGVQLVAVSFAFALLAPWQIFWLDRAYSFAFLCVVGITPAVLWRAARERSNYLWVFALAWAAPVIFAGVRIANNLDLIPWSFWMDNSTILSMTAEALLSSLAIAYRIRLLSVDRDAARAQEMAARALADVDPLTGLLNRRSLLRKAIGREGAFALMIVDIDHFKLVNETIGHDGGDEVLRVVARVLRHCTPTDALVARIGGEEFAILAPVGCRIDPDEVLARLRAERMPYDLTVTASIGACHGPMANEPDWKAMYRRADQALYQAKSDGRDRARSGAPLAIAA